VCSPSLDRACVAVTLAGTGNVEHLAVFKLIHIQYIADIHLSGLFQLEFLQILFHRNICFCKVTLFRLVGTTFLLVLKTDLNGTVSVHFYGFFLDNRTRTSSDYRNGNQIAVLCEDLGHTELFTQDCLFHFSFLLFDIGIGFLQNVPTGYWLRRFPVTSGSPPQHDLNFILPYPASGRALGSLPLKIRTSAKRTD